MEVVQKLSMGLPEPLLFFLERVGGGENCLSGSVEALPRWGVLKARSLFPTTQLCFGDFEGGSNEYLVDPNVAINGTPKRQSAKRGGRQAVKSEGLNIW